MILGDFITKMIEKAGIGPENENVKNLIVKLGNLSAHDVPEFDSISSNVFSKNEAMNNAEIKSKYVAEVYNGVDSALGQAAKLIGISDEDYKNIVSTENSTNKRALKIAEKAKELIDLKSNGDGDSKKAKALEEQISKLNDDFKNEKTFLSEQIQKLNGDLLEKDKHYAIKDLIKGQKLKKLPDSVGDEIRDKVVAQYLDSQGVVVKFENGQMKLKQKADNNLDFTGKKLNDLVFEALKTNDLLDLAPIVTPKTQQTENQPVSENSFAKRLREQREIIETK